MSTFTDSKLIINKPINYRGEEGLNPREVEINQITKLLNIIAEEIYIGRYLQEIGVYRIENRIIAGKDNDITPDHLAAYRISKEEILAGWVPYLDKVIDSYFVNTGKIYEKKNLFQEKFDDQLWMNIRNFIINLRELPLWKDRSMASTVFSGKNPYYYWQTIFDSGKSPDNVQVLARPLNFQEMIKPYSVKK